MDQPQKVAVNSEYVANKSAMNYIKDMSIKYGSQK